MSGMTLLEAARLIDELAREIAVTLPTAATDADVELVLDSKREGDEAVMLAEQLVLRLVHDGWMFARTDPEALEVPAPEDPAPTSPSAAQRHELRPEPGTKRPMCLCGYKPGPPEAQSPEEAVSLVNQHILDEQRGHR